MMMRTTAITSLLLLSPVVVSSWSLPGFLRQARLMAEGASQAPLMPLPNILPGASQGSGNDQPSSSDLIISDVIGRERSVNVFAGFIRDVEQASSRLDDGKQNSTILAPLNSQIQKLPRKPWEDPEDYNAMGAEAYAGAAGESRAHQNLRRFIEAHIVPESPWAKDTKMKTIAGNEVWWETKDGKHFVRFWILQAQEQACLHLNRFSQGTLKFEASRPKFQTERFGSLMVYSTIHDKTALQ